MMILYFHGYNYIIYPGNLSTEMLDLMLGITVLLNGIDIAVEIFSMGIHQNVEI